MTRPVVNDLTEQVYRSLGHHTDGDSAQWLMLNLVEALTTPLSAVYSLARDGADGTPGWSVIMDADLAPAKYLPWLGQHAGSRISDALSEADKRTTAKARVGFQRGTPSALRAAIQATLTGTKRVNITERANGDAYRLVIRTYLAETPNAVATLAAIMSQKPASLGLDYGILSGPTWDEMAGTWDGQTNTWDGYTETLPDPTPPPPVDPGGLPPPVVPPVVTPPESRHFDIGYSGTAFAAGYEAQPAGTLGTLYQVGAAGVAPQHAYGVYGADTIAGSPVTVPMQLTVGKRYAVTVEVFEDTFTAAGKRLFDVALNGVFVDRSVDVFARFGNRVPGTLGPYVANANGSGVITLTLPADIDNGYISAVSVLEVANTVALSPAVADPNPPPVIIVPPSTSITSDPASTANANAMLKWAQYIQSKPWTGAAPKRVISGQQGVVGKYDRYTGLNQNGIQDFAVIQALSGKRPVGIGIDYFHWDERYLADGVTANPSYAGPYGQYNKVQSNAAAIAHWNAGGIVFMTTHFYNPLDGHTGNYGNAGYAAGMQGSVGVTAMTVPGSAAAIAVKAMLDRLIDGLKDLQTAGVVVMLKLFHEWNWWCGPNNGWTMAQAHDFYRFCRAYIISGGAGGVPIHNVLWMYSPKPNYAYNGWTTPMDPALYPGDDVVDMLGISEYQQSWSTEVFGDYVAMAGKLKPYGLGEFGAGNPPVTTYDFSIVLNTMQNNNPASCIFWHWWANYGIGQSSFGSAYMNDPRVLVLGEANWQAFL